MLGYSAGQGEAAGIRPSSVPAELGWNERVPDEAQEAGSPEGWATFAAVLPQSMQQWAQRTPQGKPDVVAGYPAHAIDDGRSCMLWVDVSDQGSVFAHTITRPGPQREKTEPCQDVAKPAAEAMIQNLPNA